MKEDQIICVCCQHEAEIICKPRDSKEIMALCLPHAKAFQRIINHLGNYPVCNWEIGIDN